jgi:hypothetical protein
MPFPCRSHTVTLSRPCRCLERSLSERHIRGMAGERQGNGSGTAGKWQGNGRETAGERQENDMVYMNQTRPHCVNQVGKTQSKALAQRHGRESAWERHGVCESVFTVLLQQCHRQLILYSSSIPRAVCSAPPEDEQVRPETCRGS